MHGQSLVAQDVITFTKGSQVSRYLETFVMEGDKASHIKELPPTSLYCQISLGILLSLLEVNYWLMFVIQYKITQGRLI